MALAAPSSLSPDKATTSLQHGGASRRGSHRLLSTSCERLWALRTVYGLVPKIEPSFRLQGTLVHTCLAYHYAARMKSPPAWFHERTLEQALREDGDGAPDLIQVAKEVYASFASKFASQAWNPISVEEEYAATLGELDPGGPHPELDNEVVTCRTDLVIEVNGDLWIVDHKTTGGTSGQRLAAWREDGEYKLSWQIMLNLAILRAPSNVARLGKRVRGFIIQRAKTRQPFDFDQHPVQVSAKAYALAPRTAREYVIAEKVIEAKIAAKQSPSPNFAMCWGRYGACDYHGLCGAASDFEQNQIITRGFRTVPTNATPVQLVQIGTAR